MKVLKFTLYKYPFKNVVVLDIYSVFEFDVYFIFNSIDFYNYLSIPLIYNLFIVYFLYFIPISL
jgi:hypothetical protein